MCFSSLLSYVPESLTKLSAISNASLDWVYPFVIYIHSPSCTLRAKSTVPNMLCLKHANDD
jgi:hypothetical protein